ncbi:MAG: DUF2950 domain-containing protein [Candidatus Acidiferrales bacterium]
MRRSMLKSKDICRGNRSGFAGLAAALVLMALFPARLMAQQPGQKTFPTARKAIHALYVAVQGDDMKAMLDILGQDAKQIISSGDESDDQTTRANFVKKFEEMHRLVKEPNGTTTLYIGAENWPTPIPLVEKSGAWYFDSEAGKREILLRRVGHNEMSAIRVCQELVAAEKEYYSEEHNVYAQKFISDPDQKNGLYWPVAENQHESPVGPLVAYASAEKSDRRDRKDPAEPFHGYYFRILTRQGKDAAGGATDYIVDGKMTAGFAFLAYPAEYRNSGVMTFIVDKEGVVYQKDLGKNTTKLANTIKEYDPSSTWRKAEEQTAQSANMQEKH